jgi:hypothetical protein
LIEGDTDPHFFAPDDTAGQMIALRHQGELRRDSNRAGDIEAAPVAEILRTVQSIAPPPNSIFPAFKTRCLFVIRCSSSIGRHVPKTRGIDRFPE